MNGRTIAQSPEVAGRIAAEKRAEGFIVVITTHGSDSRRGTRVWFTITWTRVDPSTPTDTLIP